MDYVDGAIVIVIGFFITAGIYGYIMTSSPSELEEKRGPILAGFIFGGFLLVVGTLAFFCGLADYIVTTIKELSGKGRRTARKTKEPSKELD